MSSDPFADASLAGTTPNGTATAVADRPASDPFAGAHDSADPFAVSSDFRGEFIPSPGLENIQGRLVVMIPRDFDPTAKDPNDPEGKKTRELYTVDLTVLDGGRLVFPYKEKGDPEKGTPDEYKDWIVEDVSSANPFSITNYWVPQGAIIGKMKHSHRAGTPFLGVPVMGPVKADRGKKTPAQVQAEVAAWDARGRREARPRYSWTMADPTPAQRQAAIAWWNANKSDIAPINTATAPKP